MGEISWDYDGEHEVGIDESGKVWRLVIDELVGDRHCAIITDGETIALVVDRKIVSTV